MADFRVSMLTRIIDLIENTGGSMFVITEADADAIRAVFNQEGELSAAIELRRRFPGVTDKAKARACARSIAGWTPLAAQPCAVTRLRSRKENQQRVRRPRRVRGLSLD
jgi:hypothetical protein